LRHQDLQRGTVGTVGNKLVYVGSKTGRDGLGGAVFASADLSDSSEADRPAVQVGDPFMEKLLLEACLEAIAKGLVVGVQDMGAAGLTSSVGEMAHRAGLGVDLLVDKVPRRETGMTPLEVMLSESQERMVLAVRPDQEEALLALLAHWELDAVTIGEVRAHGRFRIFDGAMVADLPVKALNEAPTYTRAGVEDPEIKARRETVIEVPMPRDLGQALLMLINSPTIASKAPVYIQYDHQVMTNTVLLPGQADAAVLRIKGSRRGIAASTDCNPRYCYLDPYLGAKHAVAEAARNVACVGARPWAITNNLNFGNPTREDVYYQLQQAVEGLKDACLALNTPVTGGNVSLYNQYRAGGELRSIHPTPAVGMIGVLDDVTRHATTAFKREGDVVLLIGENSGELGASEYLARLHGLEAGRPPSLDLEREKAVQDAVIALISAGLCDTAHDCSEGGLAVALAEMAIAGSRGATLELPGAIRPDALLFGEAASRIVVALSPERLAPALALLNQAGVPYTNLGAVDGHYFTLAYPGGQLRLALADLTMAFQQPLKDALA